MRPAGNEFRSPGRVFNWDEFEALKASTTPLRFPQPDGSLFIGDKGMLTTGTYGDVTRLLPVEKMKDYRMPPPLLTRSPGHMRDFIRACKGGDPACSNFDVAAPFVEWMLLGRDRAPPRRQAGVRSRQDAHHQQRGGEQTAEAQLPQGLGVPHRQVVGSYLPVPGSAVAAPRETEPRPGIGMIVALFAVTRLDNMAL